MAAPSRKRSHSTDGSSSDQQPYRKKDKGKHREVESVQKTGYFVKPKPQIRKIIERPQYSTAAQTPEFGPTTSSQGSWHTPPKASTSKYIEPDDASTTDYESDADVPALHLDKSPSGDKQPALPACPPDFTNPDDIETDVESDGDSIQFIPNPANIKLPNNSPAVNSKSCQTPALIIDDPDETESEGDFEQTAASAPTNVNIATLATFETKLRNFLSIQPRPHFAEGQTLILATDPEEIRILVMREDSPATVSKVGELDKEVAEGLYEVSNADTVKITVTIVKARPTEVKVKLTITGHRHLMSDPRLDWARQAEKIELQKEAINSRTNLTAEQKLVERQRVEIGPPSSTMTQIDPFDTFFAENSVDPAKLKLHPNPPELNCSLMRHQLQGLRWLHEMEHPKIPKAGSHEPPVQLWTSNIDEDGDVYYYNIGTRERTTKYPKLGRGGILADEMGLGKTVQTIALIESDPEANEFPDIREDFDVQYEALSLVVCPKSVLANWKDQFAQHSPHTRVYVYTGKQRDISETELKQYQVVLVNYDQLSKEYQDPDLWAKKQRKIRERIAKGQNVKTLPKDSPPPHGLLFRIKWLRIILDEGHQIRNPKTNLQRASCKLMAQRRWILTGTPIVNTQDDLGALLQFLRLCRPLHDLSEYKEHVGRRIQPDGNGEGNKILRAIVSSILLRRTTTSKGRDGRSLVDLKPKYEFAEIVQLDPEVRRLYDVAARSIRANVQALAEQSPNGASLRAQNSQIFKLLTHLRQMACDLRLVPADFLADCTAAGESGELMELGIEIDHTAGPPLEPEHIRDLQSKLVQQADEECSICYRIYEEPIITPCAHIYCFDCIKATIAIKPECPLCRRGLNINRFVEMPPDVPEPVIEALAAEEAETEVDISPSQERDAEWIALGWGPKIRQLMRLLLDSPEDIRTLVFSQWTSYLNLIQEALDHLNIRYCRIDGSTDQAEREKLLYKFSKPTTRYKVMLISLGAGAVGLNCQNASQVVLMDAWWQNAIEVQAIARVWRIGQTRDVKVYRLLSRDTVEERVQQIQNQKVQLVAQALSGIKANGDTEQPELGPAKILALLGIENP